MGMGTRAVPDRLAHQPALDGLRGLAVIAVLAYHQNFSQGWGRGGFLGVDVFFVLSGFLITSLLLIDHARTGRVVSTQFWARRVRRLFPALLVLLAIAAAYAAFIAKPDELTGIRETALATLLYVNNYWQIYGSHRSGPLLLEHTWSLSIEEQFYVVWPVFLALILRITRGRRAWLIAILGMLTAVSVGLMSALYKTSNLGPAYLSTETRAHSLFVGAALGIVLLGWSGPERRGARLLLEVAGLVALASLSVMIAVVGFLNSSWLYHGGYLLVAVLSATLIAAAVQASSPVLRHILSVRPLVTTGVISYGVYLFHLPIYAWLTADRVGIDGIPLFGLRLTVTVAVAAASYVLVERPIRRGALTWHQMRILAPIATVSAIALVLVATLGSEPVPTAAFTGLIYRHLATSAPQGYTRVLVVGDGLTYGLGQTVGGSFTGDGIVGTTSVVGCGLGSGSIIVGASVRPQPECSLWPNAYQNAVTAFEPHISVLLVGANEIRDRVVDGKTLRVGTPEFASYLLGQLQQATKILTANGTPLLILTAPCTYPATTAGPSAAQNRRRIGSVNSVFLQFAAQHPVSVHIGDYASYLCPAGIPLTLIHGQATRSADGQLTKAGAMATWKWLAQTPLIRQRVRTEKAP
jgi:peptidoglycan/LPS O-acetylase OafA/YrhL